MAIGVRPRLRYRVHRWEVTDEAVYTLTGWLSRTWTLVPISRIQTVDVTRGVMQQLFGLASVAVLTASSRGHGAGAAPGGRRRPARGRRPGAAGGAGPRPGDVTDDRPGRRTSARVLLVHTITFRQARQFVPALIPLVAATGFGGGRTTVILLAVAITLLSLLTATLTWWRFSYADGSSAVVVTRGLLARSVRTVPTDRIRGVEIETPLVHRLFGLVRVRIDAAAGAVSGKDEEVVVDGVPRAEGDRLRTAVLSRRAAPAAEGTDGDVAPEPPEEEFARFDNRWLLYAPLVGSYLAIPAAAVGAGFRLLDELGRNVLPDPDELHLGGWATALALVGGLLLVLAVGAVIGAALVNWGFTLVRRGGSLIAVRGLLTKRHTELEIDRIRGCTVSEGLGMRWVRAARINALVTGLGDATRRGQLLPLGPRASAWALARRLADDPGPLVPHPPAARRRAIVRAIATGILVSAAGIGATVLGRLVVAAGRRDRPDGAQRPGGPGPVRGAGPRRGSALVHRPQRVARPRAGDPAAPGRGRVAGAAVVLPAPGRVGHRRRVRRRGRRRLRGRRPRRDGHRVVHRGGLGAVGGHLQRRMSRSALPIRPRARPSAASGWSSASRPMAART